MTAGITLRDLSVAYERILAVRAVSGTFAPGSLTAIMGPNGAGKSTLIKAVAGLLRPVSGGIDRGGVETRSIGYLPQLAEIDRSFPLTVADTILLGAWKRTGIFRGVDRETAARARDAVAALGLQGLEQRPVGSLSAGQFQRVMFARLLLQDAAVILLDEPFNAIDSRTTQDLLQLLRRWHGEGRTVITVLHDMTQVRSSFPQTLLLAREMVAWGPTDAVLTADNLARARDTAVDWDDTVPADAAA
ncbi:MAG: metal ABC transporter ATP-binding protein [Janthinobacterium lividum]